jgi:hypothetical protein
VRSGPGSRRASRTRSSASGSPQAACAFARRRSATATGLSFRELPVLRDGDSTPVEAGTFLAFDFAIHPESARSGAFLHVEDRIVVTGDGPVRVSDAVDTRRPISLRL